MGVVPVGDEALEAADRDRFALDAAHTLALALRLLRTYAAADGGQGGGALDHLIGGLEIAGGDLLDEFGDVDVHRAAGHAGGIFAVEAAGDAGFILAVQAALRFVERHLLGIAERDLIEVFVSDIRILRRHGILCKSHIRHGY